MRGRCARAGDHVHAISLIHWMSERVVNNNAASALVCGKLPPTKVRIFCCYTVLPQSCRLYC